MADIKKSLSSLQALYADNTTSEISPNDLRDGFKTVIGSMNVYATSTNYTADADDIVIEVDTSSGDVTITIPGANVSDGSGDTFNQKIFYIINTGANDVILSGGATNTVAANSTLGIISNGTSWLSINASGDTDLSEGTSTETTVDIDSSTGTNATLAEASTTRAGVMSKAKFDEVVANTLKTGITSGQASEIAANTLKTGITSGQATDITTNNAKTGITSGQATAITDNTAKVGITTAQSNAITANTAKSTNVTTNLSEGTTTNTTVDVNSSDGTNATLAAASTTRAGVMTKAKFDEVVVNTTKVGYTDALVDANSSVVANTAKVGYTDALVDANSNVAANTAKTGFTQALVSANTDVTANTAKVGLTDGDKGDIVVSSTGTVLTVDTDAITTTKILDDNVTFAKTQNIATDKLLGRGTAGTGSIEEITLGTNLSLTGTTLNAAGGGGGTAAPVFVRATSVASSTDFNTNAYKVIPWAGTGAIISTGMTLDSAKETLTVTDAGQYDVYASAYYVTAGVQRAQLKLAIFVNTVEITAAGAGQGGYARFAGSATKGMSHIASLITLAAGDEVEIKAKLDSSGGNTTRLINNQSVFKMHKLQGLKGDQGPAGGLLSSVGGGLLVDLGFGTTNQAITVAAGATTINFDDSVTNAVDKHGNWDNTNKKFIVNTASGAGTYQFEANLFCSNTTGSYYNLQAFVNGVLKTPNGAFAMSDAIDDSTFDGVAGTISLDLDVGDEVEIKLQAYSSTNASTTISANGTWNFTQGMRVSKTSGVKGDQGDQGPAGSGGDVYLANTQTFTGVNTFSNNINASQLINHADYPTGSTTIGNVWRDGDNLKFRSSTYTKNLTYEVGTDAGTGVTSLTIDTSIYTQFSLRNMDSNVTINAPTNGLNDGQKLTLRFRDNGTSRTIAWNAIFRAIGVTLPLSTTALKTLYVGCIYNGGSAKWDVVAVSEEA